MSNQNQLSDAILKYNFNSFYYKYQAESNTLPETHRQSDTIIISI